MTERVVLAYSGGLDTSVAIGWIAEETGAEVDRRRRSTSARAARTSRSSASARSTAARSRPYVVDARDEFADEYCLPALKANALYMDRYPLVSALSPPA